MVKLIWNAIVKNEAAIIDRCVNSLLPHIDGAVIVDTGSTDDTLDILASRFGEADKPLRITQAPFENFSQARNVALQAARDSDLPWDYLLLADADMELKVHRPDWINGSEGLAYDLKQTAGSVGYYNRRLLSRRAAGWYLAPTHEYLDVPADGILDGAEFIDHADGANRPEKFRRDIALLEKALETETNPGLIQRYHFYLAQSYFDFGNWQKAAEHYKLRTTLGGFDEEVWNAQYHFAHCQDNLGNKEAFVFEMLKAHELRPTRAETLYDLAKHYREKGDNHSSLLFSQAGLAIAMPNDKLFVNEYVYDVGLREEFAICAYYDPHWRWLGAGVCDEVALNRKASGQSREQARANQYWYLQLLSVHVPSFVAHRIPFAPPEGWVAMNPSVVNQGGKPLVLVRTVNYSITPEGQYAIRGPDGHCSRDSPIITRNYLVGLSAGLEYVESRELALPADWPEPKFDLVRGFEDSRLFQGYEGMLWTVSTVRECTPEGWCEQVLAPLDGRGYGENWGRILPEERHHEKNWMPWFRDERVNFVYRLGTLVHSEGGVVCRHEPELDVGHVSGGSQVITAEGLNIALVHEARSIPGRSHNRYYQHRFVVLGDKGELLRISPPFAFHDKQIEFAAGLAYFPDKRQLMASYGVRDCEAWLATMDFDEVLGFIAEGQ